MKMGDGGGGELAQNEFFKVLKQTDAFNFSDFLY